MTIKFWIQDPFVLIDKYYIFELWPMSFMTYNQKLNALTRIIIILSVLGYIFFNSLKAISTGAVVLLLIVLLKAGNMSNLIEGMENGNVFEVMNKEEQAEEELTKKKINEYKKPTVNNPMGNVLLTEIQDNPERKAAPPAFYDSIHEDINNKTKVMIKELNKNNIDIEKKLFQDLGNNSTFDYSMRNFYSTANTQIPNDQESFTDYLYGDMKSQKDGTLLKPK